MMKPLTEFPGFIIRWLVSVGIPADGLLGLWNELAAQAELPEEWRGTVEAWIVDNVTTNISERAKAALASAIVEVLSPLPGYDPDAIGTI